MTLSDALTQAGVAPKRSKDFERSPRTACDAAIEQVLGPKAILLGRRKSELRNNRKGAVWAQGDSGERALCRESEVGRRDS